MSERAAVNSPSGGAGIAQARPLADVAFFHGGVRGLHPGRLVLPPTRTGAPSGADFGAAAVCRRDRVYVTDDVDQARMFAIMAPPKGHGAVYEVEPIGLVEPDPDYLGEMGGSLLQVPEARVIRVVDRRVTDVFGLGLDAVVAICSADGDSYPTAERLRSAAE